MDDTSTVSTSRSIWQRLAQFLDEKGKNICSCPCHSGVAMHFVPCACCNGFEEWLMEDPSKSE
jgi:hypothetical protein